MILPCIMSMMFNVNKSNEAVSGRFGNFIQLKTFRYEEADDHFIPAGCLSFK